VVSGIDGKFLFVRFEVLNRFDQIIMLTILLNSREPSMRADMPCMNRILEIVS